MSEPLSPLPEEENERLTQFKEYFRSKIKPGSVLNNKGFFERPKILDFDENRSKFDYFFFLTSHLAYFDFDTELYHALNWIFNFRLYYYEIPISFYEQILINMFSKVYLIPFVEEKQRSPIKSLLTDIQISLFRAVYPNIIPDFIDTLFDESFWPRDRFFYFFSRLSSKMYDFERYSMFNFSILSPVVELSKSPTLRIILTQLITSINTSPSPTLLKCFAALYHWVDPLILFNETLNQKTILSIASNPDTSNYAILAISYFFSRQILEARIEQSAETFMNYYSPILSQKIFGNPVSKVTSIGDFILYILFLSASKMPSNNEGYTQAYLDCHPNKISDPITCPQTKKTPYFHVIQNICDLLKYVDIEKAGYCQNLSNCLNFILSKSNSIYTFRILVKNQLFQNKQFLKYTDIFMNSFITVYSRADIQNEIIDRYMLLKTINNDTNYFDVFIQFLHLEQNFYNFKIFFDVLNDIFSQYKHDLTQDIMKSTDNEQVDLILFQIFNQNPFLMKISEKYHYYFNFYIQNLSQISTNFNQFLLSFTSLLSLPLLKIDQGIIIFKKIFDFLSSSPPDCSDKTIISFIKSFALFITNNSALFYKIIPPSELINSLITIFLTPGFVECLICSFYEDFTSIYETFSKERIPNSDVLFDLLNFASLVFQSLSPTLQNNFINKLIEFSNNVDQFLVFILFINIIPYKIIQNDPTLFNQFFINLFDKINSSENSKYSTTVLNQLSIHYPQISANFIQRFSIDNFFFEQMLSISPIFIFPLDLSDLHPIFNIAFKALEISLKSNMESENFLKISTLYSRAMCFLFHNYNNSKLNGVEKKQLYGILISNIHMEYMNPDAAIEWLIFINPLIRSKNSEIFQLLIQINPYESDFPETMYTIFTAQKEISRIAPNFIEEFREIHGNQFKNYVKSLCHATPSDIPDFFKEKFSDLGNPAFYKNNKKFFPQMNNCFERFDTISKPKGSSYYIILQYIVKDQSKFYLIDEYVQKNYSKPTQ